MKKMRSVLTGSPRLKTGSGKPLGFDSGSASTESSDLSGREVIEGVIFTLLTACTEFDTAFVFYDFRDPFCLIS